MATDMIFLQLLYTFFIIGLFGFGGGAGMLSLIQGEVVTHYGWLTMQEFTDVVAVSQMTPGPIGINVATFAGYRAVVNAGYAPWLGVMGSAITTLATVTPSFLLMLVMVKVMGKYRNHPTTQSIFAALRPAVVGLLAAATLLLMTSENFGDPIMRPWQFWVSIFLFVAAFVGTQVYKISPIRMILYSGLAGLLLYL